MTKISSNKVFAVGFITIMVLLFALMLVWFSSVSENSKRLNHIAEEHADTTLISIMRETTFQRVLTMQRMIAMENPFERDEAYIYIHQLGTKFLVARDLILSHAMSEEEKVAWDRSREIMTQGGRAQHQALELIMDNRRDEAYKILLEVVIPLQEKFIDALSGTVDAQRASIDREMVIAAQKVRTTYWLLGVLGTLAFVLGLLALAFNKRVGKTGEALVQQGERIRALYQVSSLSGVSLDEQIDAVLKVGCRLFDMEIGRVCKINVDDNFNEFLHVVAPPKYTGASR